ncbi:hypothetical protein TRSC58_07187 [Trypanosoma rangeli SC58]|uniref:Uncharacterized protein n=1 Tax=Trypanosoma rangeli SC58 TaxID=429131 RepID=A0A061IRS9_TRYRA|nr:hypothetical protein TRSC58_07187 [Trypanosoma rangeli SC58]
MPFLFYLPNPKRSPRLAVAWSRWCLFPGSRAECQVGGEESMCKVGGAHQLLTEAVGGSGAKPWAKSWLPRGAAGEPKKGAEKVSCTRSLGGRWGRKPAILRSRCRSALRCLSATNRRVWSTESKASAQPTCTAPTFSRFSRQMIWQRRRVGGPGFDRLRRKSACWEKPLASTVLRMRCASSLSATSRRQLAKAVGRSKTGSPAGLPSLRGGMATPVLQENGTRPSPTPSPSVAATASRVLGGRWRRALQRPAHTQETPHAKQRRGASPVKLDTMGRGPFHAGSTSRHTCFPRQPRAPS